MYTPKEIHEAGLDDFRVFLANAWDFLGLPEPTERQYEIAHWLQHGPRRQIISAFRGVGKSWITVVFALWVIFMDNQKKVEIVSASQTLADDNAKFAHTLIAEWALLQHLKPRMSQRQSSLAFDVGTATPSKDPTLKSAGITGQITGSRADLIIADDVEIPKNSYTHNMREKLSELVKEFDAILKPGGRVIYLGTPQVEATLYNRLLKRGYTMRVWTAEVPEDINKYHGRLAPSIVKMFEAGIPPFTPTDPSRFNEEDLAERRLSYGLTGFALQFMLDTTPAEADKHPLKTSDLIVHDVDPDVIPVKLVWGSDKTLDDLESGGFDGDKYVKATWVSDEMVSYQGTVMAIDPSGGGKDETAYAIVRYAHGMQFLVDVGGFKAGFAELTLKSLANKMMTHKVDKYVIEKNYGGGMFDQLLSPHVRSAAASPIAKELGWKGASQDLEWNAWSSGKKEWRILDVLEPIIQSHRLVVDRKVIEKDLLVQKDREAYSFIQQMTRMARLAGCLAHEDRLEAVAMAVGYWTERMKIDTDKTEDRHKEKLLDEELRNWHLHVHSRPSKAPSALSSRMRPRR